MALEKMIIPTSGYHRYRPLLLIWRPTIADERMIPIDVGINAKPARVALAPVTTCRKRGRKIASPKLAEPMKKVVAVHTRTSGSRSNLSGKIGSLWRVSYRTNNTPTAMPPTAVPMTMGDVHSN